MKKLQNGRSMIEMLGVLAIIGVLSIGGLAGYTMAMNRHRANEILDYVSKVGVTAGTNRTTYAASTNCSDVFDGQPSTLSTCKVAKATAEGTVTVTVTFPANSAVQTVINDRVVSGKIGSIPYDTTTGVFTFTL